MDDRIKKRVITFYVAGILNAFFGIYVLIEGTAHMPQDTVTLLVSLCFVFAGVNFYMAQALKKKMQELDAQRAAAGKPGDTPR